MGSSVQRSKHERLSLASGRPPLVRKQKPRLTAVATRTLIRSHHQLNKELRKAESSGDAERAANLRQQIADRGGLDSYQQASMLGQSKDRGGDSSIVLMEWLHSMKDVLRPCKPKLKMLEIGALSTSNAVAQSHAFDIEHIDLNSQAPGILQQDFMSRPLPRTQDETFNIISLSLVLNYVPDHAQRGAMLRRCRRFLREAHHSGGPPFPALFIVLPLACIDNSRYMSNKHFKMIMTSIGFELQQEKQSPKLFYSLWTVSGEDSRVVITKREVNPGVRRNNFSIVLESD